MIAFCGIGIIVSTLVATFVVLIIQVAAYSVQGAQVVDLRERNAFWMSARFQMVRSATELLQLGQAFFAGLSASILWLKLPFWSGPLSRFAIVTMCYFVSFPLFGLVYAISGGGQASAAWSRFGFLCIVALPVAVVHWLLMGRIHSLAARVAG